MADLSLPEVKANHSEEYLKNLPVTQKLAARWGCPRRCLRFALLPNNRSSYQIHRFRPFTRPISSTKAPQLYTDEQQYDDLGRLIAGPLYGEPPSFTIINGDTLDDALDLMWHLAASIAARRVELNSLHLRFSYLGTAFLLPEHTRLVPHGTILAWGPCTGYSFDRVIRSAQLFHSMFYGYPKIMVTSVRSIEAFLEGVGIRMDSPDFIFQVGHRGGYQYQLEREDKQKFLISQKEKIRRANKAEEREQAVQQEVIAKVRAKQEVSL